MIREGRFRHRSPDTLPPPLLHQHPTLTSLPRILPVTMVEQPTDCNGTETTTADTAPADTCIMSARTVHITPVNSINNHTHNRHTQPPIRTAQEHTHSTIHNANNLNHLLTLHPPPPITLNDIHTTAHDAPIVNNPLSEHHTQHALSAPTGYPPPQ